MIEKLDIYNGYKIVDWLHTIDGRCGAIEVNNKINELIDIVNKHDQKLKLLLEGLEKWAQSQQDKETTIVFEQK